jgi:outer membrane protein OmpA-like peptidoglycan-associated protein
VYNLAHDEVAAFLKERPSTRVRIEGHTDAVGDDKANLDLSRRRAESVKRALAERGIDAKLLAPQGFGETQPIGDNKTLAGRAANRRVVFLLMRH